MKEKNKKHWKLIHSIIAKFSEIFLYNCICLTNLSNSNFIFYSFIQLTDRKISQKQNKSLFQNLQKQFLQFFSSMLSTTATYLVSLQFQEQLKSKDLAHALTDFPYYPPLDASVSNSLRPIGDSSGKTYKRNEFSKNKC